MYVKLFGALLATQLLLIFQPAVISHAEAAFQVRKAEVAANQAALATAGEDIVDVEEVDEVDEVDEVRVGDDVIDVDEIDDVDDLDDTEAADGPEVDDGEPERRA